MTEEEREAFFGADVNRYGGGPLNPVRNNETDPISFGDGRESASFDGVVFGEHEVGAGTDVASPRQSGIDPNCERSMMMSPPPE